MRRGRTTGPARARGPGLALAFLLPLAAAACIGPGPELAQLQDPAGHSAEGTPPRGRATLPLATSVQGRPIRYALLEGPAWSPGGETVLLLATIHGDEAAGTPLLELLLGVLERDPALLADRRLVVLPVANPDGLAASTRGNANGVDLNRNFDTANRGAPSSRTGGAEPLSEPESRALRDLVQRYAPARVVSFHQPLRVVDHDGPAAAFAAAVAAASDLPARRLGSRPGSLGSWVGLDLGLPILTVELPGPASRLDDGELWRRYGPLALACVTWSDGGPPG